MIKICLINLGCAKNIVDSEAILAIFNKTDFEIVVDENDADVIILNTCAFIHDAESESMEYVDYLSKLNKKIIVVGCLVEKYEEKIKKKYPNIALFVKFQDYLKLPSMIASLFNVKMDIPYNIFNRVNEKGRYSTFLKISEGCNHNCGYCIIPKLRGKYYSYSFEEIVEYTKDCVKRGIKEFTIIAQDTTYYGMDFKDKNKSLSSLLKALDNIDGIEFIRTLYLYPSEVDDELIETFKNAKHLIPYFDLPIQHASDKILGLMNRYDTYESLINLVNKIREKVPNAILRCTIIVGYPEEDEEDFNILKKFLEEAKFHHVGVFTFSNEKGTKAYTLKHHVDEETKEKRKEELMNLQKSISYKLNKELIGKEFKAIVVGNAGKNRYLIRTSFNAPDDIDGEVYLNTAKIHEEGDIVNVKVIDAFVYDLIAEEI